MRPNENSGKALAMNRLSEVEQETRRLQVDLDSLRTSLGAIKQDLTPLCEQSREMISGISGSLSGTVENLADQKRRLNRVDGALEQVKGRTRDLTRRCECVGAPDLLAKEKGEISELRHQCRDLRSDLEAVEHFHLNFKGRLNRLEGGA